MTNETNFIKELISDKHREKAFNKLLDMYQERLYWHIRKLVITHENADDVLQNTFIRVFKSLPKFQQKSSLHTWMYRIAYNESIRFIESNKKKQHNSLDTLNEDYINTLISDEHFDGGEVQLKLQKTLAKLSEKHRHIFQMKYYDDLKFREMVEILDMKEGTIKTAYYNAVKFIEKDILNIELLEISEG